MRGYAARELLPLKNGGWLADAESALSSDEFKARIQGGSADDVARFLDSLAHEERVAAVRRHMHQTAAQFRLEHTADRRRLHPRSTSDTNVVDSLKAMLQFAECVVVPAGLSHAAPLNPSANGYGL